ncbi:MAG: hypothetical protein KAU31_04145 [Spirochaetaceae bacterium]|nr:hypothetical protein [Spirochaetaceae bacterium]
MNNERLISSPFSVAGLTLPNRIVMPPLVIWKAGQEGYVTPDHRQHYGNSIGPGLMIVEATAVSPEGRLAGSQLGIWSDEHVSELAKLARLIHSSGAMAGIQIHHAGSKATLKHTYGEAPLVPSLTDASPQGAREMTGDDIARILDAFAAGTERAIRAGFDYIEVHGAHGYLMSQFLSPRTNRRQDRWGGSLANRMRFTLEAYRITREVARDRAAVGVRLGLADGKPGGIGPDDGLAVARELTALGCPILHISHAGSRPVGVVPDGSPFSATMHLAGLVKASVPVTVIGVGGILTPAQAEAALTAGHADLVAVGRGILADPEWAEKVVTGRTEEIELCVDCQPLCFHFREPEKCPARRRLAARSR